MSYSRRARCLASTIGALALTAVVQPPHARAEDNSIFSVSGFGTLGGVYHDETGLQFRRDVSQPNGAQAGKVSFKTDSMLGLQVSAHPSPELEASVQLVSRQGTDNTHTPQLTFGYIKYKPSENVAARLGRLGIQMYMQGDSAEIGYGNLLVRQPIIFYPRSFDGVDVDVTQPLGDGMLRIAGMAGWTRGKLITWGDPYDTGGSRIWGALAEYTLGDWTGRVSTGRLTLKNELSGANTGTLFAALAATPNSAELLALFSMRNRPADYKSLAMAYDSGPLQGIVSYSVVSSPNWAPLREFYSSLGYRVGKVTPYIAYTSQRTRRSFISTGLPSGVYPPWDTLNQAVAVAQAGLKSNQTDIALGVRYDLARNVALKFQVDRIRYQDPASIVDPGLAATSVENRAYKPFTLFSLAMDFVF